VEVNTIIIISEFMLHLELVTIPTYNYTHWHVGNLGYPVTGRTEKYQLTR